METKEKKANTKKKAYTPPQIEENDVAIAHAAPTIPPSPIAPIPAPFAPIPAPFAPAPAPFAPAPAPFAPAPSPFSPY